MSDVIDATSIGAEVLAPFDWSLGTPLRPGVDYHDGVTYFTLLGRVAQEKTVGKGKQAETVVEYVPGLVSVASTGAAFTYTEENVGKLGFTYPANVILPERRRWSDTSITEFTSGKAEAPNPATIHQALREIWEKHVEFAHEAFYDILPLFVMGSYMFRLFKSYGYIHFNGTMASGKSQNLRIIEAFSLNPKWTASISAAALYRTLEGEPGVSLIDESEGFDGERGEELRRILNGGYLDGAAVYRAEKGKNDQFQVAAFDVFGPKAIASINPLDNVLGSRALIVLMRPAIRSIPAFNRDDPRWQRLRDRLYLWAMFHSPAVSKLLAEWQETHRYTRAPGILSRQWEITQPLIVIADYIDSFDGGHRCDQLIEYFNTYFADLQKQQDATDRIRIVLQALPRVLAQHAPDEGSWYRLKTIHEVVLSYLEDDAHDFYKTRNLSKHLDVLGFRTKRSHKQGTQIWLEADAIRKEFAQRRVTPQPEDVAWLAGSVEYTHEPPPPPEDDRLSMWAEIGEEPEE